MERHTPPTLHESMNVFDDEFAVEDYDFIGDGFAPGRVGGLRGSAAYTDDDHDNDTDDDQNDDDNDDGNAEAEPEAETWESQPPVRSVAAYMADVPAISPISPVSRYRSTRNSIRKSRDADNPFTSAEDDENSNYRDDAQGLMGRSQSIRSQSTVAYAPGITHRSASSTSSRPFAPSSQNHSATGPSHPYAMYPQDTNLARTASVSTTASTIRPQAHLLDQRGPTHPYSMYPQNVSEDAQHSPATVATMAAAASAAAATAAATSTASTTATSHPQTHIPVGFPGRTPGFNLARGPQGEEQDIIGVDGHTEQLPPYSEYPEEGVPKHIVLPNQPLSAATSASTSHLAIPLIPARLQSMSDSPGNADAQAFASMEQMESNDSTASAPKRWKDKSWKEKRKTKFCGIPFWWIMLSMCVVAFIAIVLGGAIGGFMSSQKKSDGKRYVNHMHVHARPNPRRPYRMVVANLLTRPTPDPPSSTSLLDATPIPSSGSPPPTGTYALTLSTPEAIQSDCLTNQTFNLAWSCDIPSPQALGISIETPPSTSAAASSSAGWEGACLLDTSEKDGYSNISYGTQTPTTSFSQFLAVKDNDDLDRGPAFYFQAFYDKIVVAAPDAFPYAAPSSNKKKRYSNEGFKLPPAWYTRHQIAAGEQPWFCYWNGTFLEGFIYANNTTNNTSSSAPSSASSTYLSTSLPSSFTATSTILEVSNPFTTSTLTAATAAATTSSSSSWSSRAVNAARDYYGDYYSQLPQFGYVVKIEERRIPGSPQPYCQKMQILDDGTAGVVTDPGTGLPIKIMLGEQDPGYSAYQSGSSSSKMIKRADTTPGGCHCQWWSGR